ncbi:MAG: hypothetical protein ABW007_01435 [Chitinophagaceae bacterium]
MANNSVDVPFSTDDEGPYLNALLYDSEEAARYISERTEAPLERSRAFVNACNEYEILLGTAPTYDEDDTEEIAQARIDHADLLPSDIDYIDYNFLRAYVERTTDLTSVDVVNMIAENIGYYVKQKIMEPEAYEDTREWADEIMITIPTQ